MENRIKEQQLCLFADRTSAATMRANQLRLWFSSVAYTLMSALRRLGLKGTKLAKAQCDTIRLKLLRIGAQIKVTVRKVWVSLSESYPYQQLFKQVYENLRRLCPIPLRCWQFISSAQSIFQQKLGDDTSGMRLFKVVSIQWPKIQRSQWIPDRFAAANAKKVAW